MSKPLLMHVEMEGRRIWSGLVNHDKSPLEWIPSIVARASQDTGMFLVLAPGVMQNHPNDLEWTSTHPNAQFHDSLLLKVDIPNTDDVVFNQK